MVDPGTSAERFDEALAARDEDGVVACVDGALADGAFGRAREMLEAAVAALPDAARLTVRLLELYIRYHNWPAFDALATEARSRHAEVGAVHFAIGRGCEARRDWDGAAGAFKAAWKLAPDEAEPVLRGARVLRVAGRASDAAAWIRAALRRQGGAAPLHAALGYALIDAEQPAKAATAFRRAAKLAPDWPRYLDDLAGALLLGERWKEAARVAVTSLKQRSKSERAWSAYAISHMHLGDLERAEKGHRNAIRASANPTRAKGNYGLFLRDRPDRVLEAVRLLREAAEAHPDWEAVQDALRELTRA